MFLKRERPETDDFAMKKISGCEGRFQEIMRNFLQLLATPSQKMSFPILAFQNIPSFFTFL